MIFYEELNEAEKLIKNGQLEQGEIILRNLLKKYPTSVNIQIELGHLLVRQEKTREEGKTLLEDLLDTKKRKDAMFILGQLEKINGNITLAQYYFKTLIGSKYNDNALIELGLIEKYLGNLETSKKYFEKISIKKDIEPENLYQFQSLLQRIFIEIKLENFKKAYLLFQQLLEFTELKKFKASDINQLNLYLKYKLNILTANDQEKIQNSYFLKQLIQYDETRAIEHIQLHLEENNQKKEHTRFFQTVDISNLYQIIVQKIKDLEPYNFSLCDKYLIDCEEIIGEVNNCKTNNVKVITFPNTKNIVTMYPIIKKEHIKRKILFNN